MVKLLGAGTALFLLVAGAAGNLASQAPAAEPPPVLVELFTSEGCSSCPPADRVLQHLQGTQSRNGARIITLGEHVTYWDQLGWRDRFASDALTQRQNAYGDRFHLDSVYTPQIIVNGRAQLVGSDAAGIRRAIDAQPNQGSAAVHIQSVKDGGDGLTVNAHVTGVPKGAADWYVAIAQDLASTPVQRGENAGHTLTHASVVRVLVRAAVADGREDTAFHLSPDDLRSTSGQQRHVIVFAQAKGTGAVLAADSAAL